MLHALMNQWREANRRQTYNAVLIVTTIMNVNRKKGARAISPSDLMKDHKKEIPMTTDETVRFVEALALQLGAKDNRKKKHA